MEKPLNYLVRDPLLNRLIELEANRVVAEMRKEKNKKTNPIKKFFRIP